MLEGLEFRAGLFMQGFGVQTSMWTMKWDRNRAENAIQGSID